MSLSGDRSGRSGLEIGFLLIKRRKDGSFGQIVLRLSGRAELAEIKRFTLGGEFFLAGGPVTGTAPVFLGVEENEKNDEDGSEFRQPNERLAEKAFHSTSSVGLRNLLAISFPRFQKTALRSTGDTMSHVLS